MKPSDHNYIIECSLILTIAMVGLLVLSDATAAFGQSHSSTLTDFNERRINITRKGMLALSGWALSNIAAGSYGYFSRQGKTKYFHQMNVAWNVVNLSIGLFAYQQSLNSVPSAFNLSESLNEAHAIENILLLNIGLNVAYIATGSYLWERGIRKGNDRLKGYGPSLVLQGGFLLLFDSILYTLNRNNNQQVYEIIEHITISPNSISLTIPF